MPSRYRTGYFLAVTVLSIVTFAVLACGGEETPAGDAPAASTPAGDASAVGTATAEPATRTPDASGMPLADYLATCASPISGSIDVELDLEGFTTVLGEFTKRLEAAEPPAEVAAWHYAVLDYQRALTEELDDAPEFEDDEAETLYLVTVVFPAILLYQPAIGAAISGMDPDVYARMVEAGCIDEDGFGDDTAGG